MMDRGRNRGFTLIELLIVVAIIGIIAAIAIPQLLASIDRGRQKRSMADLRTLANAVESYQVDSSVYPTANDFASLATSIEPIYLGTAPELDGWSREFLVEASPTDYTLGTGGKDGGGLVVVGGGGPTGNFDDAIIFRNGGFVQWPEGVQTN